MTALVGLLLLGQALSRQVARESNDAGLLRALGLTRHQLAVASGLRWTATGIVAAVTAVAVMIAASPLAPIGVVRRTIAHTVGRSRRPGRAAHCDRDRSASSRWEQRGACGGCSAGRPNSLPSSTLAVHVVGPTATTGIAATLHSLRRPFRSNAATAMGAIVLVAVAAIEARPWCSRTIG